MPSWMECERTRWSKRRSTRCRSDEPRAVVLSPHLRHGCASLTPAGWAWAAGVVLLLGAGALACAWQVVALGIVSLSFLCAAYLAFYPAALALWRHHLELRWQVVAPPSGAIAVAQPFSLRV